MYWPRLHPSFFWAPFLFWRWRLIWWELFNFLQEVCGLDMASQLHMRLALCGRGSLWAVLPGLMPNNSPSFESPSQGSPPLLPFFGRCCPGWEVMLLFLMEGDPSTPPQHRHPARHSHSVFKSWVWWVEGRVSTLQPHSLRCTRHADVSPLVQQGYFKFVYLDDIRWFSCLLSTLAWLSCSYIHIYLYLAFFFWYVQLKRLGLINIFRCPVTMAMGSADIILNLIFQLPQCASPVSRIIESLLLLSPFLPPSLSSLPLILLLHILSLPVAPSYDPSGINGRVFHSIYVA